MNSSYTQNENKNDQFDFMWINLKNIFVYFFKYGKIKVDYIRTSFKEFLLTFFLSIVLFSCLGFALLMSLYFVMQGAVLGVSSLLGNRIWLGYIITGLSFFVVLSLVLMMIKKMLQNTSLHAHIQYYKKDELIFNNNAELKKEATQYKSEKDFLEKQSEMIKDEIKKSSQHLSSMLNQFLNIEKWVQDYPYASTGAGAALGFYLSSQIFSNSPSKNVKQKNHSSDEEQKENSSSSAFSSILFSVFFALGETYLKNYIMPMVENYLSTLSQDHSSHAA